MQKLLVFAILAFSISLSAQSSNWLEVIETNNVKNFEGYLYQNGEDINQCLEIKGGEYHPLAAAIKLESNLLIDHILNNQSLDLAAICTDKTILQYAVKYGNTPLVKQLIAAGADPHQLSKQGKSALDYAKKYEKTLITGVLKQY